MFLFREVKKKRNLKSFKKKTIQKQKGGKGELNIFYQKKEEREDCFDFVVSLQVKFSERESPASSLNYSIPIHSTLCFSIFLFFFFFAIVITSLFFCLFVLVSCGIPLRTSNDVAAGCYMFYMLFFSLLGALY